MFGNTSYVLYCQVQVSPYYLTLKWYLKMYKILQGLRVAQAAVTERWP